MKKNMTMLRTFSEDDDSEESLPSIEFTYERGKRNVKIQATKRQKTKSTQVREAYVKGTLYRMTHTKKGITQDEFIHTHPIERALAQFGKWQFLIQILLFLNNMPFIFQLVIDQYQSHLFGEVWCARPKNFSSLSIEKWIEISGHYKLNEAGVEVYDPCNIKDINYDGFNLDDPTTWIRTKNVLKCSSWEYEDNYSILSEWRLACTSPSVPNSSELVFSLGGIFGGILNGYIMDRFGRQLYLLGSIISNGIVSFLTALSPMYEIYLFFRCLQGFLIIGTLPALTILSMEICGEKWIGILGSTFMFSFPTGYVLIAFLSNHLINWRHLHFAATIMDVFLITGWWIIPESPRWLWVHQNCDRLLRLIEDALYTNGNPIIDHNITHELRSTGPMLLSKQDLKIRIFDLFKTQVMRKRTYVSIPLFFCSYLSYYGIVLRLNFMYNPHEIYRAHLFSGMSEFTATAVCLSFVSQPWVNDSLVLFVSNIFSGILLLFINSLPSSSLAITYYLVGVRFFMSITNCSLMTYIARMYPTNIRGTALCCFHTFSFIALSITGIMEKFLEGITIFLMGMSGIVAAFLVLLLPLNNEGVMPDTIQEVEDPFHQVKSKKSDHHEPKRLSSATSLARISSENYNN